MTNGIWYRKVTKAAAVWMELMCFGQKTCRFHARDAELRPGQEEEFLCGGDGLQNSRHNSSYRVPQNRKARAQQRKEL